MPTEKNSHNGRKKCSRMAIAILVSVFGLYSFALIKDLKGSGPLLIPP